jgi:hypothetical protein
MSAALQKPAPVAWAGESDGLTATALDAPDEPDESDASDVDDVEDAEDAALVVGLSAGWAELPETLPHPARTTVSTAPAPTTPARAIVFGTMVMRLLLW